MADMIVNGPKSFSSFGKVVSEEKIFRNRPIRNKNCLWWPYLLMDRNKMSNLYRGPPIDASYPVSVHLAKRFQRRRFFRNQPFRNKNCLWWPCLLKSSTLKQHGQMDQNLARSIYGRSSIGFVHSVLIR